MWTSQPCSRERESLRLVKKKKKLVPKHNNHMMILKRPRADNLLWCTEITLHHWCERSIRPTLWPFVAASVVICSAGLAIFSIFVSTIANRLRISARSLRTVSFQLLWLFNEFSMDLKRESAARSFSRGRMTDFIRTSSLEVVSSKPQVLHIGEDSGTHSATHSKAIILQSAERSGA